MADGGRVVIRMETDNTKAIAGIKKTETAVKGMTTRSKGALQNLQGAMGSFGKGIISMLFNPITLAIGAFTALIGVVKKSITEANNLIRSEARLESILKTVTNATDEQIQAIEDLADEYERLFGIADDTTKTLASQLASFGLTADAIEQLLVPALDTAVANYNSLNITQEQAINLSNLLGKAYQGQWGALTRVGILVNENQKQMLENGNEAERLASLIEILEMNYGGLAEAMANTPEGKMKRLREAVGNIFEAIGVEILPALGRLADTFSSAFNDGPLLKMATSFGTIIGRIFDTIGALFELFSAFNNISNVGTSVGERILIVMDMIGDALGFVTAVLRGDFKTAFLFLKKLFAGFLDFTANWVERILNVVVLIPRLLLKAFGLVLEKFGGLFADIIDGVTNVLNFALEGISKFVNFAIKGINKMIDGLNKLPFTNIRKIGEVDFSIDVDGDEVIQNVKDAVADTEELLGDFPSMIGDAIRGLGDLVFDEEDKKALDDLTTTVGDNSNAVWQNSGGLEQNTASLDHNNNLTEEDVKSREDFLAKLFRDIREGIFDRTGGLNQQISRNVLSGNLNVSALEGITNSLNVEVNSKLFMDGREVSRVVSSEQRTTGGYR